MERLDMVSTRQAPGRVLYDTLQKAACANDLKTPGDCGRDPENFPAALRGSRAGFAKIHFRRETEDGAPRNFTGSSSTRER